MNGAALYICPACPSQNSRCPLSGHAWGLAHKLTSTYPSYHFLSLLKDDAHYMQAKHCASAMIAWHPYSRRWRSQIWMTSLPFIWSLTWRPLWAHMLEALRSSLSPTMTACPLFLTLSFRFALSCQACAFQLQSPTAGMLCSHLMSLFYTPVQCEGHHGPSLGPFIRCIGFAAMYTLNLVKMNMLYCSFAYQIHASS